MPFGFPFRTRNTIVEVYGVLLFGSRFCQSFVVSPAFAIASTSYASASVTTSASSPSMTARAWLPDPPCDCSDGHGLPGLGLPVPLECGVELADRARASGRTRR